ncbi:DUF11 domain-containing protein [bacterium]|nr:DUF11 domain-containing protein [bacterium]
MPILTIVCFASIVQAQADLELHNSIADNPIFAGENQTYFILYTNHGPDDAQDVSITTEVPPNTTFVSASGPAGWTIVAPPVGGTGNVTFSNDLLTIGSEHVFLEVKVDEDTPTGTIISDTATITSSTPDDIPDNNTDSVSFTVILGTDLSIAKSDSPDPVAAGADLTYTLDFMNGGPANSSDVLITDATPLNTTFVSATAPEGWIVSTPPVGDHGDVSFWKKSGTAPGEIAQFTMVLKVNSDVADGSTITNIVNVYSATPDQDNANNTDSESTGVQTSADVSITKSDSPDPVEAGTNLAYTLNFQNNGASNAQNVLVSDPLPANTTFVFATVTSGIGWSITAPPVGSNGTVTFSKPSVTSDETASFKIVVLIDSSTPDNTMLSNTVTAVSDTADPDSTNNNDTETTLVTIACLFCEEFDDSTLNTNWSYIKSIAQWSEDGSNLIGSNSRKTRATAGPVFSGCSVCTVFTSMQTAGGLSNRVWLLAWYQDADNYVELLMKQESGTWVLKQRVGGVVVAKKKARLTILPNTVYAVQLTFSGTDIQAFIDGSSTPDISLTVGQAPNGSVGFKVKGTTGTFDFIRVF